VNKHTALVVRPNITKRRSRNMRNGIADGQRLQTIPAFGFSARGIAGPGNLSNPSTMSAVLYGWWGWRSLIGSTPYPQRPLPSGHPSAMPRIQDRPVAIAGKVPENNGR